MQFKLFPFRGDTKEMRQLLVISLILSLSMSTGCMVLDEIDAAAAKMPKPNNTKDESSDEPAATASSASRRTNALLLQSKRWWGRATSLAPADVESSIVRCRLGDGTHFMSKDDCLGRGGIPNLPRGGSG